MLPLPKIVLSASEYPRLEQLARVATQRFVAGCMNVVRIESVTGAESNVVPLVRASVFVHRRPIDNDRGPTAA